jgi:hypothetical protein
MDAAAVKERDRSIITLKTGIDAACAYVVPQASTRSSSTTSFAPPSKGL